ncbi:MAG TPA: PIG-L family deacetylase, partial [Propionibacteriaceae bacterium]|nr:PIG-L family deacetylase [Propionibacteriaceae bacterium]
MSSGRARLWAAVTVVLAVVLGQLVLVTPRAEAAVLACSGGVLNVMAHEDDDLLFASPDLLVDIDAKRCTSSLFLSAGDAGYGDDYWQERERGSEAAFANMAGVSNSWTTSTVVLAGKSVRMRTLTAAPWLSLMFLRLPDGGPMGPGFASRGYQTIKKLLDGTISRITAVDGSASYSASELRNAVLDAMRLKQSANVRTHDYVTSYGDDADHFDHHATAFVARDASSSFGSTHRLASYLGYDSSTWAANVSGTNLTRKTNAFAAYAAHDDEVDWDDYLSRGWLNRQYVIASSGPSVVANAGPDLSATAGQLVTLDATGSWASGSLSYSWAQTGGPAVTLSAANTSKPTFRPSTVGSYTFRVTASSGGTSGTDTVVVSVTSADYVNVARLAGVTVTASSQESAQPASNVVDGLTSGWPDDATAEWSTIGGGAGSWVQLAWSAPVKVDRVVLYDRPNANDQVTKGTLTFTDGTTVAVGTLLNAGATTITFPARSTSSIRFSVEGVSSTTENIGLSEFEAYGGVDTNPPVNRAPVANAGVD